MAGTVECTAMPWLPPVSFAERPDLEVMPTAEEIRSQGLRRQDIRLPGSTDLECEIRNQSRLLALPLELRLAIYRWVYLATPVHHKQPAPWYPVPQSRAYVARALTELNLNDEVGKGTVSGAAEMLSATRPLCYMPTSLLRINREIYHEARTIPFVLNEFVFINWFSSGVCAARSVARRLRQWQLSSMRQVRLDLYLCELMGSGSRELSHVCASLSMGLRGLRLRIVPGGSRLGLTSWEEKTESWTWDAFKERIQWEWVEETLSKLKCLERLEVELQMPSWTDDGKIEWCRKLEDVLRNKGNGAKVICVEEYEEDVRKDSGELLKQLAM